CKHYHPLNFKGVFMFVVNILKIIANFIYGIFKLFPVKKNKVLFLSRQSNKITLDYKMIIDELEQYPSIKMVTVLNRTKRSFMGFIKFIFVQLISMYHLATSSVCLMDSYWPAVSVLNHKSSLTVIQIWHASGKIKKSGYQTLDLPYGRKKKIADIMSMHHNYDVIIAGGEALNNYYCESFNVSEDKLFNVGLPRLDHLIDIKDSAREKLLEFHPECAGKKIIFYAPTFRKGELFDCSELCKVFDREDYILFVKPHSNQRIAEGLNIDTCHDMSSMTLIAACDYLITDYSAIAFEAAAIKTKTLFYLHDYEKYVKYNGLNIDPAIEMPECTYFSAEELANDIFEDKYDSHSMESFADQYLPTDLGHSTKKISSLIIDCIERGKDEGISRNLNRKTETLVHLGS
ncbi:MAG: CDP-glycerol glycerophosphotransferase family protein, partial [Eubacterium sp.]|nr:CDP-glycerol glycerophosphotransferase family protein [Eubacterium sp.]